MGVEVRYRYRERDTVPILLSHVWLWCSTSEIELILALWISWNYDQVTTVGSLPVGMLNQKSSYSNVGGFKYILFCPKLYDQITIFDQKLYNMLQVGGFSQPFTLYIRPQGG